MTLADWLDKYNTTIIYDTNACRCVGVFYLGGKAHVELFHLTDYLVSSVCGSTVYMIQRM